LYWQDDRNLEVITRRRLEDAASQYDVVKYSEAFYNHQLGVLKEAPGATEAVAMAVKYLFLWKLGKVSRRATERSFPLGFSDSQGRQYHSTRTTPANREAIERAIASDRPEAGLLFRDGRVSYEMFKLIASALTASTIVLPAFYVHIWRPSEHPIIDVRVWRVFCREQGRPASSSDRPRSWDDYEAYTRFLHEVVAETGLDWRTVDRGLWVLGGSLTSCPARGARQHLEPAMPTGLSHEAQSRRTNRPPILPDRLERACQLVSSALQRIPFRHRGILITQDLIRAAIEELNAAPNRVLPQNCRQLRKEDTPDGLDRRIKERLNTDLRTANIISDVLQEVGIAEVIRVRNPDTGRMIKATRLRDPWNW